MTKRTGCKVHLASERADVDVRDPSGDVHEGQCGFGGLVQADRIGDELSADVILVKDLGAYGAMACVVEQDVDGANAGDCVPGGRWT